MNVHSGLFNACAIQGNAQFVNAQITKYLLSGNSSKRLHLMTCLDMLLKAHSWIALSQWMSGVQRMKTIAKVFTLT